MDIINKDLGNLQLKFEESDLFLSQSTLPGQNEKMNLYLLGFSGI